MFKKGKCMITQLQEDACVVLIGMAGAGKTTVGEALAKHLNWAFMDTDRLIEAVYGARLQTVTDSMDKESFLDLEAGIITSLRVRRSVLATGGSVIYRESSMRYLSSLGTLVYLDTPLPVLLKRIAAAPDRGLAIGTGQSIEDLFWEREPLYRQWADISVQTENMGLEECVSAICRRLACYEMDHA